MYSYEDRIKAVRLYLKLGKRLGVTIRQLGYPTKNTLIGWYREFIAKQSLRAGYIRARDRFTVVQTQNAGLSGHCQRSNRMCRMYRLVHPKGKLIINTMNFDQRLCLNHET